MIDPMILHNDWENPNLLWHSSRPITNYPLHDITATHSMAYLLNQASNTCFPLAPHHTFGRLANSVDTLIDKPYISKLHAAIEWTGSHWCLKSLGLNGTLINGDSLTQGDSRDLNVQDKIHFAEPGDPGFVVIDLTPPCDMLWPLDQSQLNPIPLSQYHLLPDANHPELALFFDESTQLWYSETLNQGQEQQKILDGDQLEFAGGRWQFVQVQIYGPTEAKSSRHLNDYTFIFHLSLDEETTQLELHYQQTLDFGVRTHHYLLLQLARHRIEDAERGLDSESQGWIYADQLAAELGLDITHLNIQIFRARKQLADTLPTVLGQQSLIERRGGKLRFGCDKVTVYKGARLNLSLPLR